jgi:GxxExxY protein
MRRAVSFTAKALRDAKDAKMMRAEPSRQVDQLAQRAIGAALEVHRTLGPGYVESMYEEALCIELRRRDIPFARQPLVGVSYKGHPTGELRLDLLVGGQLIIELKAVESLLPVHSAQLISYLKATGHQLGLLINFNVPFLREGIKRLILT